ncbi:MAG: hypothetical protein VKJ46_11005 [Leptolyngbyaceae bacterium]|nr:hypothetical protein [Leptolyngbyaceae bacterium]
MQAVQVNKTYDDPELVATAAQQLLDWYMVDALMLFPYYIAQSQDSLTITTTNRKTVLLKKDTNFLDSCLEPADYEWFQDRIALLRDYA